MGIRTFAATAALALLLTAVFTLDAPASASADAPPTGPPGVIETFAGGGTSTADSGNALDLAMTPFGLAFDLDGNVIESDQAGCFIRRISNGMVTVLAGTRVDTSTSTCSQESGDGGPATSAVLGDPLGIASDGQGNLFMADWGGCSIRRVDAGTGIITTIAGGTCSCSSPCSADYGAALILPLSVAVDSAGAVCVADLNNCRILKVSGGTVTRIAGAPDATCVNDGDGSSALTAHLAYPVDVAVSPTGDVYIAAACEIRKVTAGIITTVAGNHYCGYNGDGPATVSDLEDPSGIAVDAQGTLFIAESDAPGGFCRVRMVRDGYMSTVVGDGPSGFGGCGFSGDGGSARAATLRGPTDVALDAAGNLYIADNGNRRIRIVYGADRVAPPTSVGGIAEAPDLADLPSRASTASSGHSTAFAFGGSVTVVFAAVALGGWAMAFRRKIK